MVAPGEYNYSLITLLGKQIVEVFYLKNIYFICFIIIIH